MFGLRCDPALDGSRCGTAGSQPSARIRCSHGFAPLTDLGLDSAAATRSASASRRRSRAPCVTPTLAGKCLTHSVREAIPCGSGRLAEPAIDRQASSRDVAAVVGREEDRDRRDLFGFAEAPERDLARNLAGETLGDFLG